MKKILLALLLFPTWLMAQPYTAQQEQDRLINFGMNNNLAIEITEWVDGGGLFTPLLPNNEYLSARNADDSGNIGLLKLDDNNVTVVNSDPTSAITLRLGDDNRLINFSSGADATLFQNWGDDGTTATQIFTLRASTLDADDDSTARLCGGGAYAADGSRGACIILPGEEVSGGGDISYVAGASDTHVFSAGSTETMSIGATGLVTAAAGVTATTGNVTATAGDLIASTSGKTLRLQEATAGAKCMGTLTANGATPVVTSTTCAETASRIFLSRTSAETGTVSAWISAISNATSFSITSEAADTGTYNWIIFNEAP